MSPLAQLVPFGIIPMASNDVIQLYELTTLYSNWFKRVIVWRSHDYSGTLLNRHPSVVDIYCTTDTFESLNCPAIWMLEWHKQSRHPLFCITDNLSCMLYDLHRQTYLSHLQGCPPLLLDLMTGLFVDVVIHVYNNRMQPCCAQQPIPTENVLESPEMSLM